MLGYQRLGGLGAEVAEEYGQGVAAGGLDVLDGELSQYMPDYLPLLRKYVSANDPFSDNADYVSLSVLGGHSVPLGAALHFISAFLDEV